MAKAKPKGRVARKKPVTETLKGGKTYQWCSCGKSKKQPWCDGSHKGTEFKPVAMKADETVDVLMCQCKQTRKPGFCDGSHNKLAKKK